MTKRKGNRAKSSAEAAGTAPAVDEDARGDDDVDTPSRGKRGRVGSTSSTSTTTCTTAAAAAVATLAATDGAPAPEGGSAEGARPVMPAG